VRIDSGTRPREELRDLVGELVVIDVDGVVIALKLDKPGVAGALERAHG
jgi:hypothetical protein